MSGTLSWLVDCLIDRLIEDTEPLEKLHICE
jgi:hypothetical protein